MKAKQQDAEHPVIDQRFAAQPEPSKPNKKLEVAEKLAKLQEKENKRGIVYVSRIPPHMKPAKLRHLLEQHGTVSRVYCAPEDPGARAKRKKQAKDTGKNFTEGWVEFENKKVAKKVAEMLNGQPMGGKRRGAYHYDLWNLKYLRKFKWHHLTEDIAYERAVREQKMAAELRAAKRERDFYLGQVNKAKAVEAIAKRKAAAAEAAVSAGAQQHAPSTAATEPTEPTESTDVPPGKGSRLIAASPDRQQNGAADGDRKSKKRAAGVDAAAMAVKRRYGQRPVKALRAVTLDDDLLGLVAGL